ncbi:MAG: hypothetical protein IIB67_01140 [Proteobacteria bacterium]|nr:hypothetical protein [Pseudomonadota bacterium]
MSWKHEIQLRDLDGDQSIEVLCRRCHHAHYERVSDLIEAPSATDLTGFSYLDEVEKHLACNHWGCPGPVTITLANNAETSAFVGGLP